MSFQVLDAVEHSNLCKEINTILKCLRNELRNEMRFFYISLNCCACVLVG